MQKVEGSNPFSRFEKGLHLQALFVGASAGALRRRAPMGTGDAAPRREPLESSRLIADWSAGIFHDESALVNRSIPPIASPTGPRQRTST